MLDLISVATPFPVHVSDTVHTAAETDWFVFWIAVAGTVSSALVAIFTAFLALKTSTLASETKRMADKTADLAAETLQSVRLARAGVVVADQHHQESQSPIIVIMDITLSYEARHSREAEHRVVSARFNMKNIGFGPALNIRVTLRVANATATVEPKPLGAGDSRELQRDFVWLFHFGNEKPTEPSWEDLTLTASYENAFGSTRTTAYSLMRDEEEDIAVDRVVISPQPIISRHSNDSEIFTAHDE